MGLRWVVTGLLIFTALISTVRAVGWDVNTPLDEYVFSDDGAYTYEEIAAYTFDAATVYVYNMTSQIWFDENWSSQPLWYHTMFIGVPNVIRDNTHGFLVVEGGGNDPDEIPDRFDDNVLLTALLALDTQVVIGFVKHVPNQPLFFPEDWTNEERTEDEVIAWTWYKFFETYQQNVTNPNYLALFPMVKAAKRALDTVQSVTQEKLPFLNLTKFGVTGGSKRGWTSWLLSAVDTRITMSCPIVFSVLNMPPNLMHHYQSLGGWTFAFQDYWHLNLTQYLTDPMFQAMADQIDPYSYRERLTMPKLLTSGTNDEFFLPDETPIWWDDMPQPMYLQMVNNANHGMEPRWFFAYEHIAQFVTALVVDMELPTLTWTVGSNETNGWIVMNTSPFPNRVRAWVSDTLPENNRRDYRRHEGYPEEQVQPIIWNQIDVDNLGNATYSVTVDYPPEGEYRAFFLEARWPGVNDRNILFTTEVYIIPEELPFPPCEGVACLGTMV